MQQWDTIFNKDGSRSLVNAEMRSFEIDFDGKHHNLRYEGMVIMRSEQLRELLDAFDSA